MVRHLTTDPEIKGLNHAAVTGENGGEKYKENTYILTLP